MRKKSVKPTRKQQRKQNRIEKKVKKNAYFTSKKSRQSNIASEENFPEKSMPSLAGKAKNNKITPEIKPKKDKLTQKMKSKKNLSLLDEKINELKEEQKQAKQMEKEIKKQRVKQLQEDAAADDLEIKRLEKQLKLKKRSDKAKSNFFASDGLDYLLEVCDKRTEESSDKKKGVYESDDDSDFDEDLAHVMGVSNVKTQKKRKLSESLSDSGSEPDEQPSVKVPKRSADKEKENSDEDDEFDEEEEEENGGGEEEDEDEVDDSEEGFSDYGSEEEDDVWEKLKAKASKSKEQKDAIEKNAKIEEELNTASNEEGDEENKESGTWEDIYGRTRDNEGNVVAKYQPPHLRKQLGEDAESSVKLQRLKKQMKGLLNRLAENNLVSISSQVEALYSQHSRNEMNETLWSLYQDAFIGDTAAPERLVAEHALLLAVLSANVGTEVAAHCLQRAITEWKRLFDEGPDISDKRTNNVLLLLSFMCHLKLFHCTLLFDIMDRLIKNMNEKEVELILLILRTVGFTLRKEDPVRLKEFVLNTQTLANNTSAEAGTRTKYLLDVVMAIKNNNVSKIPNYNAEYGENLRKILRACIRKGNYNAELKISLEDLLMADERGRWWVVGSAWTGELPGEKAPEERVKENKEDGFSSKLMDLAKKQRMNTDARRSVFCVLMSAEDYLDAFEKLLKLRLQGPSEREIMNVLLHCLLQEKRFNPYYEHLARKFCVTNRRFQIMLQFATWDRIQGISTLSKIQVTNLSKFLANLIVQKNLAISVLKVVELGGLDKPSMRFMRQVLLTILLSDSEEDVMAVFARVAGSKPLKMFRESLRLFLHHFVLRNSKQSEGTDMELLTSRVKMAEMALSSAERGPAF